MANERTEEELIEEATTAFRPVNPDGSVRPHPSWLDLPEAARLRAFDETLKVRKLEAALSPRGLSSTASRVLDRIRSGG